MVADMHACSYQCNNPPCIKRQRDELLARIDALTVHLAENNDILRKMRDLLAARTGKPGQQGGPPVDAKGRAFPMGYDSCLHGLVKDNVASALLRCGINYLPAGVLDTIASEVVRGYHGSPAAEAPEPDCPHSWADGCDCFAEAKEAK